MTLITNSFISDAKRHSNHSLSILNRAALQLL